MMEKTEESIVVEALNIPAGAERDAFVQQACLGRPELKLSVESLLQAYESGDFLERLASIPTVAPEAGPFLAILTGTMIGPYKIREQIGEGGFGVVFVAEQEVPIRRKVALKLIKPGMDSETVVARFEAERQALAMMDHPNVAKVLDAGTTVSGRPYFVMELVRGGSITKFCDQQKLSIRARLELFCDVCRAVQHAHQKGIIHRDLKPSNILVTMHDDRPVVMVIDFGVAKALHSQLSDVSVYTAFGQIIGTPMYMSPEQAQLNSLDVDTRSDIYSLGVLLYELLTGSTPFDREIFKRASFDEMRRIIREDEPLRPSNRLNTLESTRLSTIADRRLMDVRKLSANFRGDLDCIVMKTLEKDRNRRYASASTLALDVEHYLLGEPVEARPPAKWYSIQKLLHRNRVAVTTAGLVVLAIMAGSVIAAVQAVRAINAEQIAITERDRALLAEQDVLRLLYAADVRRAADAWYDHDVSRMHEALTLHLPAENQPDVRGFEWHYLWRQKDQIARQFYQTSSPAYFVLPLPDGRIATAGADGQYRLFDDNTGQLLRSLDFGQGELNGLAVSPDGTTLASAGDDGTIALRKLNSLDLIWSVRAHQSQAFQVAFAPSGDTLISCGNEPDAQVLDAKTGTVRKRIPTAGISLEGLAISNDGLVALATNWDGAWLFQPDLQTVLLHQIVQGKTHVCFSATGKLLALGFADGTVVIERVEQPGRTLHQWKLTDATRSLAFSPDERLLAVGDSSGAIHLLTLPSFTAENDTPSFLVDDSARPIRSWQAHDGRLYGLGFSYDGGRLFTAGQDGRVASWAIKDNELPTAILRSSDMLFDQSGNLLTAGESELQVIHGNTVQSGMSARSDPWRSLAMARNTGLICATQLAGLEVFQCAPDLSSTHSIWTSPTGSSCRKCLLSPDGRQLVVEMTPPPSLRLDAESSRYLDAIDLATGKSLYRIPCGEVGGCVISPDGRTLAYTRSAKIHVVDATSGVAIHTLAGHQTSVNGIAIDPSNRYLASTSRDRSLKLWDLQTGQEIWSTFAHRVSANAVAFSSDGFSLATVGDDSVLRLWCWGVQRLTLEITLRAGPAKEVEFSPDSKQLAVLFKSGELQLLDAAPLNR